MFCPKCGTENADTANNCTQCGYQLKGEPQAPPQYVEKIPNYLAQSILVTILCCLPLGIPAIVYAAQVNNKILQGDTIGAVDSSSKAKMWCWIAFGVGIGFIVLYLIFVVAFGLWSEF